MSELKIPGPPIAGMNDLFLGVSPNRPKPSPPPKGRPAPPSGGKLVPIQTASGGHSKEGHADAKAASINVLLAGKKALEAANKATTSVQKYATNVKVGSHSPLVPLVPVGMRDNGKVVLGAGTAKPLTPQQTAAVQRHIADVAKTAAATRRLAALAQQAKAAGNAAIDASKKTTSAIAAALKPKWSGTRSSSSVLGMLQHPVIGSQVAEWLDGYYTAVGAAPDPSNPGFLTDGSPDPAFATPKAPGQSPDSTSPGAADQGAAPPSSTADSGMGPVTAPDGSVLYDPATDPAVVPIPTRGGTLSSDDAQVAWQHVPDDGIPYDGSHGLPKDSIGSWNVYFGTTKDLTGQWGIPGFLRGSPPSSLGIVWMVNIPELPDGMFHMADNVFQSSATSGAPECTNVAGYSLTRGWGPVIGNPAGQLAGLQYAIADKVFFWQSENAPTWATAETDAKIAAANKKTIQANRTAALVQAAQMAKDAAAQREAQSKQDAANALAQSAADSQTKIVQQQVEAQKSQLDVQQQKAELDAAKAQAQNEAQAQHALVTQADIWNKWAAQHPDQAMTQMQQGGEPAGDDYVDEGDDGEPAGQDEDAGYGAEGDSQVGMSWDAGDSALTLLNPGYALYRLFGGRSATSSDPSSVPAAAYGDISQTAGYRNLRAQGADALARGTEADRQRAEALRALRSIQSAPVPSDSPIAVNVPSFSIGGTTVP